MARGVFEAFLIFGGIAVVVLFFARAWSKVIRSMAAPDEIPPVECRHCGRSLELLSPAAGIAHMTTCGAGRVGVHHESETITNVAASETSETEERHWCQPGWAPSAPADPSGRVKGRIA